MKSNNTHKNKDVKKAAETVKSEEKARKHSSKRHDDRHPPKKSEHHHTSPRKDAFKKDSTPRTPKKDGTPRTPKKDNNRTPRKERSPRHDSVHSPKSKENRKDNNIDHDDKAIQEIKTEKLSLEENNTVVTEPQATSKSNKEEEERQHLVTEESPLYRPGFPDKFQRRVSKNNVSVKQFPSITTKSDENDNSHVANVDITDPAISLLPTGSIPDTSITIPDSDTSIAVPVTDSSTSNIIVENSIPSSSKKKKKTKASPSTKSLDGTHWVLVNDGKSEFYFNKETKAISFTLPDPTTNNLEASVEFETSIEDTNNLETSMDEMNDTFNCQDQPKKGSSNSLTNNNWLLRRHNSARVLAVTDWEVHLDFESGQQFYYNTITQVSQWEIPDDLTDEQKQKVKSNAWDTVIERSHATSTLTINAEESNSNTQSCDWTVFFDPDSQHHFYHNNITNESSWEVPASLHSLASSKASNKTATDGIIRVTSFISSKIGSWNAYMDDNKRIFYHHEKTNETSWAPPLLDNNNDNRHKRLSFADDDDDEVVHSIDDNMSNLGL